MTTRAEDADVALRASFPTIDLRGQIEVIVGRSRSCHAQLLHASISARHARLARVDGGVEIEDLGSRFGTAVNGAFVRRTKLKAGDLVRFGSASAYRFSGEQLQIEPDALGMTVCFKEVTLTIGGRHLLEGINAELRPGSFTALLGPSGAGKSLFLGCLATTLQPDGGSITFDGGRPLAGNDLAYYRSKLGLVPQDELIYGPLTVRENLRFAAELRLDEHSTADLDRRVDAALDDVRLTDHQHKPAYVLSGGQQKRVSVAIELLTRPRLLLLDEPTSGLDPGMQARVMDMLRGLARQGITIVTSTHTLDTLHYFDSALVLAPRDGATTIVFHGPPSALLPAFDVRDVADLFDLLAKGEAASANPKEISQPRPPITVRANHASGSGVSTGGDVSLMNRPAINRALESDLRQASAIARRSFRCLARDAGARRLAIVQPFALALLVVGSQMTHASSTIIHFFLVVAAIWLGMTLTVREIVRERPLYLRDRLAGLAPKAYIGGKIADGAALAAAQGAVLFLFARAIIPLFVSNAEAIRSFNNTSMAAGVLVILFASIGGAFLGLTISTLAKSEQAAIALLPLIILPQILFSRVAHGDGFHSWGEYKTPYVPLANAPKSCQQEDFELADALLLAASLPMFSRPACATLDMLHVPSKQVADISRLLLVECLYFSTLLFGLGVSCYFIFLWREKNWRSSR